MALNLCWIAFSEIGYIIGIAVLVFGITAVWQNPFINLGQKILWIATILLLNWIGLLLYYYKFYIKGK